MLAPRETGQALREPSRLLFSKTRNSRRAPVRADELRLRRRSMEACLMPEVVYPLIYWPVGIALGSWLFFEIAKRM